MEKSAPAFQTHCWRLCLSCVADRQVQLEKGDSAAQELVNSLQVLEVMAGAMAAELKSLVRLCLVCTCHSKTGIVKTDIIID